MNETGTLYTTADGWTIDTGHTLAARVAWRVKWAGGEAEAAEQSGLSLEELRRDLQDHRLEPEPVVTPEAKAVLARPLPVLDVPLPGEATEADLIRLCDFAVSVNRDYQKMDWVTGCTIYNPPADFAAKRDALGAIRHDVEELIIDIPATTLAGICAKGRALMAGVDPGAISIDSSSLVWSILADCGVDEWGRLPSPGWIGERDGTVPVSDGEPVTLPTDGTALAA